VTTRRVSKNPQGRAGSLEKAQDIEVAIPVKKSQETRYNLDPGSFFINRSWGRRADGVAINESEDRTYFRIQTVDR